MVMGHRKVGFCRFYVMKLRHGPVSHTAGTYHLVTPSLGAQVRCPQCAMSPCTEATGTASSLAAAVVPVHEPAVAAIDISRTADGARFTLEAEEEWEEPSGPAVSLQLPLGVSLVEHHHRGAVEPALQDLWRREGCARGSGCPTTIQLQGMG